MILATKILLFFIAVNQVMPITFKLVSSEPTCLKLEGGETYVLEYVSSGENDKKVRMEVYENDRFVMKKEDVNDFSTTLKFESGVVKICFSRLDSKSKQISFDFYREADPIRVVIDKKDVAVASKSLTSTLETLKEIGRNQNFRIERDEISRVILQQSQTSIKWAGLIKIAFLLTSAIIQLWIMKSFFRQNSIPYQPVDQ